jgi:hypothetical protein
MDHILIEKNAFFYFYAVMFCTSGNLFPIVKTLFQNLFREGVRLSKNLFSSSSQPYWLCAAMYNVHVQAFKLKQIVLQF